jgi:hypothetical protein
VDLIERQYPGRAAALQTAQPEPKEGSAPAYQAYSDPEQLGILREELVKKFSPDEFASLAVDIGVDLELVVPYNAPYEVRVLELIQYLNRRGQLPALQAAADARLRPKATPAQARALTIRITPLHQQDEDVASPLDDRPARLSLRLDGAEGSQILCESQIKPAAQIPYHEFAERMPPDLINAFLQAAAVSDFPAFSMVIEAPASMHGPCWEAFVDRAAPQLLGLGSTSGQHRRTVPRGRANPFKQIRAGAALVWIGDRLAQATAWRGWDRARSDLLEPIFETSLPRRNTGWSAIEELDPDRVVVAHLIGVIQETNSGLRLQIGAEESRRAAPITKGGEAEGQLAAGDLPRSFPSLTVAVLQAPPLRSGALRVDSSRREAALRRAFAARVHEHGVPVVIVLPALPADLGAEMVARIAETLGQLTAGDGEGLAPLYSAMAKLRESLFRPRDGEELLDLCLFAKPEARPL